MAVTYEIHADRQLVVVTGAGILSYVDLVSLQHQLLGDTGFSPRFDRLLDFRLAKMPSTYGKHVTALADTVKYSAKLSSPGKTAVVASEASVYGLSRMFTTYTHDIEREYRVFRTLDEAAVWLGLEGWRGES